MSILEDAVAIKRPLSEQQSIDSTNSVVVITVEHEQKINKAVEIYQTQFRNDIRTKVIDLGLNMKCQEQISQLLQYIYDYPPMKIKREQIISKKKNKKPRRSPSYTPNASSSSHSVDEEPPSETSLVEIPSSSTSSFPLSPATATVPCDEPVDPVPILALAPDDEIISPIPIDKCSVMKPNGERCLRKLDKNCPGFCSMHKKKHKILVKCICIRGIVYNVDEYGNVYKEHFPVNIPESSSST